MLLLISIEREMSWGGWNIYTYFVPSARIAVLLRTEAHWKNGPRRSRGHFFSGPRYVIKYGDPSTRYEIYIEIWDLRLETRDSKLKTRRLKTQDSLKTRLATFLRDTVNSSHFLQFYPRQYLSNSESIYNDFASYDSLSIGERRHQQPLMQQVSAYFSLPKFKITPTGARTQDLGFIRPTL